MLDLALFLLCGLLVTLQLSQYRQQQSLVRVLRLVRVHVEQVREVQLRKLELVEKQVIAEKAVEAGSIGVETVHKAVAGLTFGILEAIPATRASSAVVREVHNMAAAGSYDAVRKLNREVGKVLKEVMSAPPPSGAQVSPPGKPQNTATQETPGSAPDKPSD